MSHRRFEADILGKWPSAPLSDPISLFRRALDDVNTVGETLLSEKLFLPLSEDEAHLLTALHVPTTDEVRAMDEQILALAKVTADSINVRALERSSGLAINPNGPIRGKIDLIEATLMHWNILADDARAAVVGMRNVQHLRSSASAHRRGSDYVKVLNRLSLARLSNRAKVQEMIMRVSDSLSEVASCLRLIFANSEVGKLDTSKIELPNDE